jgi:CubicO group peptidase (beta-lactamase class C family)
MIGMRAIITCLVFGTYFAPCPRAQNLSSRIERYLNAQVLENGFSGTVLVAQGDAVLINKSFAPPSALGSKFSQAQNRFPVGSIAEQFIAAAILQLEVAGQVGLDSPICDYISDCPSEWKQIHILHLLTHSSGLPSLEGIAPCVEHAASQSDSSAVIPTLSKKSLLFKPGNKFNGNKLDYFFLSLAIEKVSGQSTSVYLEEHIFHPLKLAQTGYLVPVPEHNSTGIKRQEGCPQGEHPANPMPPFFAEELYTTADDLYRWDRALTAEQFLPKNSLDQMFTPYIEGHGFGWKIIKEFNRKLALQNTEFDSASVSIRRYPDDATCIIVVSHIHNVPASVLSHDLGAVLFGKHYPTSPNPASAHPPL